MRLQILCRLPHAFVLFRRYVDQLCSHLLDFLLHRLQLGHAFRAVRSPGPAQKFQHQRTLSQEVGQRKRSRPVRRCQRKLRRMRADLERFRAILHLEATVKQQCDRNNSGKAGEPTEVPGSGVVPVGNGRTALRAEQARQCLPRREGTASAVPKACHSNLVVPRDFSPRGICFPLRQPTLTASTALRYNQRFWYQKERYLWTSSPSSRKFAPEKFLIPAEIPRWKQR